MRSPLAYQASLFDDGQPAVDVDFAGLQRIVLDERSWVDYCPGWLQGSDDLFADMVSTGRFSQRTVTMWENVVAEPRLTAGWDVDVAHAGADAPPEAIKAISTAVSARYGVVFDRVWVNLYRDGRDSVAWHGDRNRHSHRDPLVVTVSLGAKRRFLLRPRGGTIAHELRPGMGDLAVMGGACQHEWEHTVPKEARAVGPRMSITMRHTEHLDRRGSHSELTGIGPRRAAQDELPAAKPS